MAIGGYETPVVYGHTQIFDPTMAAMVLDVNKRYGEALKAEYERGLKDFEDFSTKYGDFISPFSKDMERYGEMMGNIKLVIDQAYANGIDLTRSPEGRLLISRMTHSIDPAEFNNMRSNAKLGYEYLKNVAEAEANGTFNQEYEDWILNQKGGLGSFSNFSSAGGNIWNRPSPSKYQDPNTLVSPLFEHMQDEYIDSDGQYDYSGVSRERRAQVLSANLGALLKTQPGKYQYELSKQKAQLLYGPDVSEEKILDIYQNDLLDASNRFEHRTRTENKSYARREESQLRREEDTHRTRNDIWAAGEKAEREEAVKYKWEVKRAMDKNGDGLVSEEERKNYSGLPKSTKDGERDIVNDSYTTPNTVLLYDPNDPYKAKVTPIDGRIEFLTESKKGEGDAVYIIPNEVAEGVLYRYKDGRAIPMLRGEMTGDKPAFYEFWKDLEGVEEVDFKPAGKVITLEDEKGNKSSYMFGQIDATGERVLMKVKSNKYNYNK